MTSKSDLNTIGNISLGCVASLIVNLSVQPFSTLKIRAIAGQCLIPPGLKFIPATRFLYSGTTAITITDISQNCLLYSANGFLHHNTFNPWFSAALAGALTAPGITLGEEIMINQQVHELSLIEAFKKTVRSQTVASTINSLSVTVLREVSYGIAVFALPKPFEKALPLSHESTKQFLAGLLSGVTMGLVTTPLDIVKTRVQKERISPLQATKNMWLEFQTRKGLIMLLKAAAGRTSNIGLAIAVMNLVNNTVPGLFPRCLYR